MKNMLRSHTKNVALLSCVLIFFLYTGRGTPPLAAPAQDSIVYLKPKAKHKKEAIVVAHLLTKGHYKKKELNNELSAIIFKNYIESLDPGKFYFLADEIQEYKKKHKYTFDDLLFKGELELPFEWFMHYRTRALTRIDSILFWIDKGLDFSQEETLHTDYEARKHPRSHEECYRLWKKTLKHEALTLKLLNDPEDDWEKVYDTLRKRYERTRKSIVQYHEDDVFQLFMNAVTTAYDPHTSYFSPTTSENFQISMSKSFEGIGARLREDINYTIIDEIIAGGPAERSKALHKGDKIIAVTQGDTASTFVSVLGWRIDEVVQLIRGPKGTVVRLRIIPSDAVGNTAHKEIRLVRDKIDIKDATVSKKIHAIEHNAKQYKLGVIKVSSFYVDWKAIQQGEKNYKSATRDTKALLEEMKADGVEGLVIDLRNNGGGALSEAVSLAGLFFGEGPVVQVKDLEGSVHVSTDDDANVAYAGPLLVLVNRFSASASEIFAGAMQDYGRALVVGEPTYGKGTVQNLLSLDRYISASDPVGELKITLAKYYRVNGESTQNKGVVPDIVFPSGYGKEEYREASRPHALKWDDIKALKIRQRKEIHAETIEQLRKTFSYNLKHDPKLQKMIVEIERTVQRREEGKKVALSYATRKKETEEQRALQNKEQEQEQGNEELKKDHHLRESLSLLSELVAQETAE